jgi:hypothetical protein
MPGFSSQQFILAIHRPNRIIRKEYSNIYTYTVFGERKAPMNTVLIEQIRKMPPDKQREVEDFVLFLNAKPINRSARNLRQTWAGALKKFRTKFTSLQLQKKALEWRSN